MPTMLNRTFRSRTKAPRLAAERLEAGSGQVRMPPAACASSA